jgi:hypothetical protein
MQSKISSLDCLGEKAVDEKPNLPQKVSSGPAWLPSLGNRPGEGLINSHLGLTAPQSDGFFLPMEGYELREDSQQFFRGLESQNTMQDMIATMAVGIFNASMTAISEGSRQDIPLRVRDVDLRHGMRGATVVAQLLKDLHSMQTGGQKRVSVGTVNVAPGGQAVVGNVTRSESRKRRKRGQTG